MIAIHFKHSESRQRGHMLQVDWPPRARSGSYFEHDDVSVYYWSDDSGKASYVLLGRAERDSLTELGKKVLSHFQ